MFTLYVGLTVRGVKRHPFSKQNSHPIQIERNLLLSVVAGVAERRRLGGAHGGGPRQRRAVRRADVVHATVAEASQRGRLVCGHQVAVHPARIHFYSPLILPMIFIGILRIRLLNQHLLVVGILQRKLDVDVGTGAAGLHELASVVAICVHLVVQIGNSPENKIIITFPA